MLILSPTHIYMHTHVCVRTHTHTQMHTPTHTHTHTHAHRHACTHTHTNAPTHPHTYIQWHTHARSHTHTHSLMHTHTHTHTHTHAHTHTQAHTHTHAHTQFTGEATRSGSYLIPTTMDGWRDTFVSSECAWPWAELSLPTLVGNLVSNKKQDCETVKTDTEKTCGIKNIKKLFKYVTAIAKGSMRIPPPPHLHQNRRIFCHVLCHAVSGGSSWITTAAQAHVNSSLQRDEEEPSPNQAVTRWAC